MFLLEEDLDKDQYLTWDYNRTLKSIIIEKTHLCSDL